MSRAYDGLVRQCKRHAFQGLLDLLERASGEVSAADRTGKEEVAREELAGTRESHRASSVAGRRVDAQCQSRKRQLLSITQLPDVVWLGPVEATQDRCFGRQTERDSRIGQHPAVGGVHEGRDALRSAHWRD